MPSDSTKPLVFISYAHLDEPDPPRTDQVRWLTFVMEFLWPGVKGHLYEVWIDRLMPGGADWNPEIEQHVRACDIFVLLVSTHSTGADYILDKEVPIIRERQGEGDSVHFYPLLLDYTPDVGLDQVRDKNLRPRDGRPFSSLSPSERSRAMTEAANEIAGFARAISERKAATAPPGVKLPELLTPETAGIVGAIKGRQGVAGPATPDELRPRGPAILDIGGLPETGYERLVGRDAELKRLDEAWSNDRTSILSLIAEGGAGKSALVNEWLRHLRADSYRGATIVLGWSFFSQGSKERATSADEFLNWALAKLGVTLATTSASAKGEAIAEALMARRALLLLDGVEPLQHGPGPQAGQLKDQGLRSLLRGFAAAPPGAGHSLIVLTSRLAVADLKRFKDGAAPVVDVDRLSDEAGAELLRDNDVWGIDRDLKAASNDFGGHPLALSLLASYLKETQNGDVRRRDHLRGLLADADNPRHDQARRVMESYEKEWLVDQPQQLLVILQIVGLFDRPASGDCLQALRAEPAIPGLTETLIDLSDDDWRRAVARLREVRLLAPVDPSDPEALDAHPLVREWFGDRLRRTNEPAWKAAHSRLYDHLRDTTHEGQAPTLADLAPLYHAIAHGCQAGRQEEALRHIYRYRVCRRDENGIDQHYSRRKLGAIASNLTAMLWFFDRPYEEPCALLKGPDRVWVLIEANYGLRTLGRVKEAAPAAGLAQQIAEEGKGWKSPVDASSDAADAASNSSENDLLLGNIRAAVVNGQSAVAHADNAGRQDKKIVYLTTQATALHAAGEERKAEHLFDEAKSLEGGSLKRLAGFRHCELLLSQGRAADASDQAMDAGPRTRVNED